MTVNDIDRSPDGVDALVGWRANWQGLRVLVLGSGVTGFAAADTLAELGARVMVASQSVDEPTREIFDVLGIVTAIGALDAGPGTEVVEFEPELVIVSPGFAPHHPVVRWVVDAGIPLWGDIELAWRLRDKLGTPAEWITVTGTNGKTTTVQLTAAMLVAAGFRAAPAGNIGTPVLDAIRDPIGFDVLVVELSSFQLHYTTSISPYASACLNLADDHLDWHGSFEAYRAAKGKVYQNTKVACVYNRSDSNTQRMVEGADVVEGCRAVGFSLSVPGPSDFGVVDGILCDRAFLDDRASRALEIATLGELAQRRLDSGHTVANILAAAALARSFGAGIEAIRTALWEFTPDHHRSELVADHRGVQWINDSKATNPHAARASLGGHDSVVWIVGGLLKGASPDQLVSGVASKVRAAILIGADRTALRAAFARHAPELPVFEVDTLDTNEVMPSAVKLAAGVARSGDVVLLAPAAASMDQFINYGDRGNRFAQAVQTIVGGEADDHEPPATPSHA